MNRDRNARLVPPVPGTAASTAGFGLPADLLLEARGRVQRLRDGITARPAGGASRPVTLVLAAVLLVSSLTPAAAAADEGDTLEGGEATFTFGRGYPKYPSLTAAEWITSGAALTGAALIFFIAPKPDAPRWQEPILFDTGIRDALRLDEGDARDRVVSAGDALFYALVTYPFLVDVWMVSLGIHRNADLAGQMFGMNLQSNGVSMFVSFIAERLVARERPIAADCAQEGRFADGECEADDLYQSFWSGHATGAFTAAGLTCAHHAYLPLYGSAAGDASACVAALALAGFIGYSRVAGDMHYATDVLTGSMIGLASGFGLPWLLHYRSGSSDETAPRGFRGVLTPTATSSSLGLLYVGMY